MPLHLLFNIDWGKQREIMTLKEKEFHQNKRTVYACRGWKTKRKNGKIGLNKKYIGITSTIPIES